MSETGRKEAGADDTLLAGGGGGGEVRFGRALAACCVHAARPGTLAVAAAHVALALLVGGVYYGGGADPGAVLQPAVFYVLLLNHLLAITPAIFTMCGARSALLREKVDCSLATYYGAVSVRDSLLQVVLSVAASSIVYAMLWQPAEGGRVLMFLGAQVLTALVAQSAGQLAGLAAPHTEAAAVAAAALTVPLLLFSGPFPSRGGTPRALAWLASLDFLSYGFEGSLLALFGYDRDKLPCAQTFCMYRNPATFLRDMSLENASYWLNVVVLIGWLVATRAASCALVLLKCRRSR